MFSVFLALGFGQVMDKRKSIAISIEMFSVIELTLILQQIKGPLQRLLDHFNLTLTLTLTMSRPINKHIG